MAEFFSHLLCLQVSCSWLNLSADEFFQAQVYDLAHHYLGIIQMLNVPATAPGILILSPRCRGISRPSLARLRTRPAIVGCASPRAPQTPQRQSRCVKRRGGGGGGAAWTSGLEDMNKWMSNLFI